MITLSNSSPIKLLIIHGLNNNLEGFYPLRDAFQKMGFDPHLVTLPGHGEDRDEARSFNKAFKAFSEGLDPLVKSPYVVIAFSQGALYFQLWMQTHGKHLPEAQVLLAPALFIKRQTGLEKLVTLLPSFAFIISQTPRKLRRYQTLFIWEYRTLFEAIKKFQSAKAPFLVPSLIMMDPQDELIDAEALKGYVKSWNRDDIEFSFVERPDITAPGLGRHHVFFHPDYFEPGVWLNLMIKIKSFFSAEV